MSIDDQLRRAQEQLRQHEEKIRRQRAEIAELRRKRDEALEIVDRLVLIEKAAVAFGSVDLELDDACDADINPSPELDLIDRHTGTYLALKHLCREAAEKARKA